MAELETRAGGMKYAEFGSGEPLILLHATLHDRHDYDAIIPALAKNNRVIAIDWPGHGESAPVSEDTSLNAPLLADLLADAVDSLGLERVSLIGNSVGGFAAAHFAATQPDRVSSLVLVNSGGFTKMNVVSKSFCAAMGTPRINRAIMPLFIRSYMKSQSDSDQRVARAALTRARTDAGTRTAAALWKSFADPRHDLTTLAGRITAPTLIVWGNKDTAIPLRDGKRAESLIPGARLETLPTGHVAFSSQPEEFLSLVEPFLSRSKR